MPLNRPIVRRVSLHRVQCAQAVGALKQRVPLLLALAFGILLLAPLQAIGQSKQQWSLQSPDGNVRVEVQCSPLSYSATYNGQPVIKNSPLGLEFKDQPSFGELKLVNDQHHEVDLTTVPVWGKSSPIRNHYREMTLSFAEQANPGRKLDVIFRAYADGVAFRYSLPASSRTENFVVTKEQTTFHFPGDPIVWATIYASFHNSYEGHFPRERISDLPESAIIGLPLLAQVQPNLYVAITEADLTDWAGMSLKSSRGDLVANLSPRLDDNGLVVGTTPHASPWRVLMLGITPGALIESNIIENLNPPSAIKDTSWIQPGMMAWDHWWSGDVKMDNDTIKRYISFAGEMGFPYQLIDWQWYGPFNQPGADVTRPAPQLDMPMLLQFAKDHHVRVWLWIHSGDVNRTLQAGKLDDAFAAYERWGIAGVKIDFMDSDDQDMVNWYRHIVELAAAHHLMVDFHGAFKPTGLRVTYPNLLTREGVEGNEYNKFTNRVTPTHKLTIPFTRMLAGPMDYTPGGFLNRSPAEWKQTTPTEVMGSRAQELALFVVYWSPLTCVTDDPEHYRNQPGLELLRAVPTVWDETKVLDGVVGEHIVVARRKGDKWFIGAMTGDQAYNYQLPLSFLGNGTYTAHLFTDPEDSGASYEALSQSDRTVTSKDTLALHMRSAGGAALYFEPVKGN
jgi:alpha-glucosidase